MSDLNIFLQHNVEGYLFEDLKTLKAASITPGKTAGAVGYPLVMTAFAGIELLGALVSTQEFNPSHGAEYFTAYWSQYLYDTDPARKDAGNVLYKLVRHGLAHVFVTKGDIGVAKGAPSRHLMRDDDGCVWIDANQLAEDLMSSYCTRFKPLLTKASGPVNLKTIADRYKEMVNEYTAQATPLMAKLKLPTIKRDILAPHPINSGPVPIDTQSMFLIYNASKSTP
ncbi:MAG: hypothetical protein ABH878_05325 [bacterium]